MQDPHGESGRGLAQRGPLTVLRRSVVVQALTAPFALRGLAVGRGGGDAVLVAAALAVPDPGEKRGELRGPGPVERVEGPLTILSTLTLLPADQISQARNSSWSRTRMPDLRIARTSPCVP
ncbi:hypothetical protein GCM10010289_79160 [Streptomyces violascens]|uniref:Uncharacterized protein n=1 Tax=Streptomyces violascens TaxID=67381 RepID=A0ABQ3QEX1_9ACTN|nr:hypothetical protein GCM10010289_79160 [Streptomyces violascens]GHI35834.1 hypothetical protein Sviol_02420 [Streptomyces violascens]